MLLSLTSILFSESRIHLISAVSDGMSRIRLSWRGVGGGVVGNFWRALVGRFAVLISPWPRQRRDGAIAGGGMTWLAGAEDRVPDEIWG